MDDVYDCSSRSRACSSSRRRQLVVRTSPLAQTRRNSTRECSSSGYSQLVVFINLQLTLFSVKLAHLFYPLERLLRVQTPLFRFCCGCCTVCCRTVLYYRHVVDLLYNVVFMRIRVYHFPTKRLMITTINNITIHQTAPRHGQSHGHLPEAHRTWHVTAEQSNSLRGFTWINKVERFFRRLL